MKPVRAITNLDAERPVVCNIGGIANIGYPQALDTVRRIMLAPAAIPGTFSTVLFEVRVDGGVFAQAFLYPETVGEIRRQRMAQPYTLPSEQADMRPCSNMGVSGCGATISG